MENSYHIVKQVLDGDTGAFNIIINDHQRLVKSIIYPITGQSPDADDLIQEVFIKVYEKLHTFRFDARLSTWIGSIAYNHAINYVKRKKNKTLPLEALSYSPVTVEQDPHKKSADIMLKNCLLQLPAAYQMAIQLYHFEELKYQEIAQIMQIPEGTVKSYIFRGRQLLKEIISPYLKNEILYGRTE